MRFTTWSSFWLLQAAKGVKIVHCCGYDSVPSDIGTLVAVNEMRQKHGCGVSQVGLQDGRCIYLHRVALLRPRAIPVVLGFCRTW